MRIFTTLELLPYLQDEEYTGPLIERFIGASQLEQQRILELARELKSAPIVGAFHFPDLKTGETDDLFLFEGYATAQKTKLTSRGLLQKEEIKIPQIKIVDKKDRWEFTIEHNAKEKVAFITVCEIYKQHRRRGLFPQMVGAIQDYCFNELGVNTVLGHARPPRDESAQDWRTKLVTHNQIKITALQSLWLSQPYAVFGNMVGASDADSFALNEWFG